MLFTFYLDKDDNIYVTGSIEGSNTTPVCKLNFGNNVTATSDSIRTNITQVFAAKFTSNTTPVWAKFYPIRLTDQFKQYGPKAILPDSRGNSYIFGSFVDTLIIGIDTLMSKRATSSSGNSISSYVLKLDSSGTVMWLKGHKNNRKAGMEACYGAIDKNDQIILVTRSCSYDSWFGPQRMSAPQMTGSSDRILCKMDTNLVFSWWKYISTAQNNNQGASIGPSVGKAAFFSCGTPNLGTVDTNQTFSSEVSLTSVSAAYIVLITENGGATRTMRDVSLRNSHSISNIQGGKIVYFDLRGRMIATISTNAQRTLSNGCYLIHSPNSKNPALQRMCIER